MILTLGIDPGMSGGMALISQDRSYVQAWAFEKSTPSDLSQILFEHALKIRHGFLEGVGAMPKQGVSSTFKFGMNYGLWQGLLIANDIPFDRVYPLKWQTVMSCRTKGNKNISKSRAQELFPSITVTHAIADALLIAEYGRRIGIPKETF